MSKRIVERTIISLKPCADKNIIEYDSEISGFGVRVTPAGVKSFILDYRIFGRKRRYTIGRYLELTATAARNEALALKKRIRGNKDEGTDPIDPMEERERERHSDPTVEDLAIQYMERHAIPSKKAATSIRNDLDMIARFVLPMLGKKVRVKAIGKRDIEKLHTSMQATPYQANRTLTLLKKMFSLAIEWDWLEKNPAKGVEPYHEDRRENWLKEPQIQRFREALNKYPDQNAADALRLLMLTGSRLGEVLNCEWSQFDLERGVWTKPSHATKQKREEHVPLSAAALDLLLRMKPKNATGPLFLGKENEDGEQVARTTLRKPWLAALKAAGLTEATMVKGKRRMIVKHRSLVRIHDLRHSFASHLVSNGVGLQIVGKLLGHVRVETTARYAHCADEALRAATNQLADIYTMTEKKGA